MNIIKFHIPTEVRKALKGKKAKVDTVSLFHAMAPQYLEMLKILTAEAGEQKDVDELERTLRREDPRDRDRN
jgi:hypothetical protein